MEEGEEGRHPVVPIDKSRDVIYEYFLLLAIGPEYIPSNTCKAYWFNYVVHMWL